MENKKEYEHIPQEKFEFAQLNTNIHDTKIETKSRGYFADAMLRFKKNKSSVAAAWIIALLVVFSIVSPIVSPYDVVKDQDPVYVNFAPFYRPIAELGWGIMDGGRTLPSANERVLSQLQAIALETGMDPVLDYSSFTATEMDRGQEVEKTYYKIRYNAYYNVGVVTRTISYEEYENIQKFQNENDIQVLYPAVDKAKLNSDKMIRDTLSGVSNIWYECTDDKGTPKLVENENGEMVRVPAYSTKTLTGVPEYNSKRIDGDPWTEEKGGGYTYCSKKSGALSVRVCYYNFVQYQQWAANGEFHEPMYLMGTNNMGQDLFAAIGVGARFSLLFAVVVAAINLTIGAIYGAIQGYYGGWIDLILDRIVDVLSGVPFIVVATLFQLHLAERVGSLGSFLFAFILTGWIGMAGLTRKQFYRFKSQEHILAARTLGASDKRLMFKHIFPNSLGTMITSCALVIPGVIGSETNLTYLGIVNLSNVMGATLGTLMQQGQTAMTSSPHAMFFPAIFFALLMISFNLFGNGLRDAFNPTMRGAEG